MKLTDKDTNKDAIILFLKDPDATEDLLTDKQRSLLGWYLDAYTLIRNYTSVPDAVAVLIKMSAQRGEKMSQSTARRYIRDAREVYGDVYETKAIAEKHLASEVISDAIAMARNQNDPKTMIYGASERYKITGKEKEEHMNEEMLQQHVIEIGLDAQGTKTMALLTGKGSVDLDVLMGNVMNSMAEDANIIDDESEPD